MLDFYIGTCSWKYPSWEGLVYASREPADFLAEYAEKYNSVEVDQWFWSLGKSGAKLPRKEDVLEYNAATPQSFRFTIKCPNALTLTHHYNRKRGEPLNPNSFFLDTKLFHDFYDAIEPLNQKIGLLIFQFEYLNQQKVSDRRIFMDQLATFLQRIPPELPYAVELRNPRWVDGYWFDLLRTNHVAPVLLQGYWMDSVSSTINKYRSQFPETLCIRLHGEDREVMEERTGEDWSQIIRAKDDEIQAIMKSVRSLDGQIKQIYLNINNHYEGSAPRTIEKIKPLLLGDDVF